MLNLVTPIQETRAYQSIFAEGEAKGDAKGKAKGKAEGGQSQYIEAPIDAPFRRCPGLGRAADRRGRGYAAGPLARRYLRCRERGRPDRSRVRLKGEPVPAALLLQRRNPSTPETSSCATRVMELKVSRGDYCVSRHEARWTAVRSDSVQDFVEAAGVDGTVEPAQERVGISLVDPLADRLAGWAEFALDQA